MEIFKLPYTKAELSSVPASDRSLLLRLGSFHNDIQILNKQAVMAMQADDEAELDVLRLGTHAVAMLNLRMLSGRLHEAWVIVRRDYREVAERYQQTLAAEALGDLQRIEGYFDVRPASLIEQVRHCIGFHAGPRIVGRAFNDLPDDMDMGEFISPTVGNTLFCSAEMALVYAVNALCGRPPGGFPEAMSMLQQDAHRMSKAFGGFIAGYARAFMLQYFPERLRALRHEALEIGDLPPLDSLRIPFFVDTGRA